MLFYKVFQSPVFVCANITVHFWTDLTPFAAYLAITQKGFKLIG